MKNNTNDKLLDSDEKAAEIESQGLTEPANRTDTGRNSKGQFKKGVSGNPKGRPPVSDEIKQYGKDAPSRLRAIAEDPECPLKLKADIEKWFAEMTYGKAAQQVDLEGTIENTGIKTIKFEGVLDDWSK